jgi:hypothetical protein
LQSMVDWIRYDWIGFDLKGFIAFLSYHK